MRLRILITPGDPEGIGLEVAIKALDRIRISNRVRYMLWHNPSQRAELRGLIKRPDIDFIKDSRPAPFWVEDAARQCLSKRDCALVTGPLSKSLIRKSGLKAIGHSELLRTIAGVKETYMAFIGRKMRVVLATDHCPLDSVPRNLTARRLRNCILQTERMRKMLLPSKVRGLPLILLGLNPHAGEQGLLGREELVLLSPAIRSLRLRGISIEGPVSPDGFFSTDRWRNYSAIIACYHDQGLIPFKLVHGQSDGIHLTLGLPFVRTSVDHGTAYDIHGKGLANEGSMLKAIQYAKRFLISHWAHGGHQS